MFPTSKGDTPLGLLVFGLLTKDIIFVGEDTDEEQAYLFFPVYPPLADCLL